jgi:hypothetical protein
LLVLAFGLMVSPFGVYFQSGSLHAFANVTTFLSPLIMTAVIFNVAALKGNTDVGRSLFGIALATLGIFGLLTAVLVSSHAPDIMKALVLARTALALVLIDLFALVVALLWPMLSRRTAP